MNRVGALRKAGCAQLVSRVDELPIASSGMPSGLKLETRAAAGVRLCCPPNAPPPSCGRQDNSLMLELNFSASLLPPCAKESVESYGKNGMTESVDKNALEEEAKSLL